MFLLLAATRCIFAPLRDNIKSKSTPLTGADLPVLIDRVIAVYYIPGLSTV